MTLEKKIFDLEGGYLEDTNWLGNVVVGWKGFVDPSRTHDPSKKSKVSNEVVIHLDMLLDVFMFSVYFITGSRVFADFGEFL